MFFRFLQVFFSRLLKEIKFVGQESYLKKNYEILYITFWIKVLFLQKINCSYSCLIRNEITGNVGHKLLNFNILLNNLIIQGFYDLLVDSHQFLVSASAYLNVQCE